MRRQTIAIGVVGTLVVLVAWYLLLWGPKGRDLEAARERRDAAQVASSTASLRLSQLQALEARKDELLATKASLVAAVPADPDVPGIILAINRIAAESGVAFIAIAPTTPVAGVGPGEPSNVGLSLSLNGGYYPVMDFLGRLAALPRLVTVEGITLTPETEGLTVSAVSVTLTARAFTTQVPLTPEAIAAAGATSVAAPPPAPPGGQPAPTSGAPE